MEEFQIAINALEERLTKIEAGINASPKVVIQGDGAWATDTRPAGASVVFWVGTDNPGELMEPGDFFFVAAAAPDEPDVELVAEQRVSDDFFRENSPVSGSSKWQDVLPGAVVFNNTVRASAASLVIVAATEVNEPDQYAQAYVIATTDDSFEPSLGARLYVSLSGAGEAHSGYYAVINTSTVSLHRVIQGDDVHIGRANHDEPFPLTATLELADSRLVVLINGVSVMDHDDTYESAVPPAGNVGFGLLPNSDIASVRIDRFRGGSFVEATE